MTKKISQHGDEPWLWIRIRRLNQIWYSCNHRGCDRLKFELLGEESNTITASCGIQSMGRVVKLEAFGLSHDRSINARPIGGEEFFLGPVLQKYHCRGGVGDKLAGIEPCILGFECVEPLRANLLAIFLNFF